MARIGVIGLGLMGGGMAARLVEVGNEVVGYDLDERSRSRAAEQGVRLAESVADACGTSDFVLTSLPNAAIVREVWNGAGGVLASSRPDAVILEVSTIDPATMRELAAAAQGPRVLDAPVTGGPVEARAGTLTFLLGGAEEDIQRAAPVLEGLARAWHHAGPVGDGKTIKLANNVMSAANILVAAEAFASAVQAGMDPQRVFDILSVSGGSSSQFLKRFQWAVDGDFDPRFTVALAAKDLGLALDSARMLGVPAPMTSTAREVYQMAMGSGYAGKDMVAVVDMYRHWAAR